MRTLLLALLLSAGPLGAAPADTHPTEVKATVATAERLGAGHVRFWGFELYFAELWATDATPLDFETPFALALTYTRSFSADELANATIDEITRISGEGEAHHAPLRPLLLECFADVEPGDRITGVSETRDRTTFFVNGAQTCAIDHPAFSQQFFGIWLGDGARDPRTRDRLLGRLE